MIDAEYIIVLRECGSGDVVQQCRGQCKMDAWDMVALLSDKKWKGQIQRFCGRLALFHLFPTWMPWLISAIRIRRKMLLDLCSQFNDCAIWEWKSASDSDEVVNVFLQEFALQPIEWN